MRNGVTFPRVSEVIRECAQEHKLLIGEYSCLENVFRTSLYARLGLLDFVGTNSAEPTGIASRGYFRIDSSRPKPVQKIPFIQRSRSIPVKLSAPPVVYQKRTLLVVRCCRSMILAGIPIIRLTYGTVVLCCTSHEYR